MTAGAETPVGLAARASAWRLLQAVAAGAYTDVALERERSRHPLAGADRALATELACGAIRQRRLLDGWIDTLGRVPARRQPPRLRWLLHVGLYQLLFSERVPPSAAVSTSVELAKAGGLARLAPVVNGLLRELLRRRGRLTPPLAPWDGLLLPQDPSEAFGLRHSLPPWLAEALPGWQPDPGPEAFARACNEPPPLDLRLQPLRSSRQELLAAFTAAGVTAAPIGGLDQGLTLLQRPGDLRTLPGYGEGLWSVQDRSAQRIVPLLDPRPGQWVLDACAAPGGKCSHIAEWMGDRGVVQAIDRSARRLERVRANLERLGLRSVQPLAADASALAVDRPDWLGRFDRILVDAPCSGLGTLARHADARWRMTPSTVSELAALQQQLLEGLAPLAAAGGRMVYATCTVHPRENRQVVEAFLATHPTWRLERDRQWWPGDADGGDGFYAAVLEAPPAE